MKLTASREEILAPLQSVIGVVERRQTMPVLANVLLAARDDSLSITGTDLEVELVASRKVAVAQSGDITIPGRKLLDIFRALPEKTNVTLSTEGERATVRAGKSRFTRGTSRSTFQPCWPRSKAADERQGKPATPGRGLRPCFEHDVERRFRGSSKAGEAAFAHDHRPESLLARLRAECGPVTCQRYRNADHR